MAHYSGKVLDLRSKGLVFKIHRRQCVVSISKKSYSAKYWLKLGTQEIVPK